MHVFIMDIIPTIRHVEVLVVQAGLRMICLVCGEITTDARKVDVLVIRF